MSSDAVRVEPDPRFMERAAIERLHTAWSDFSGKETPEQVATLKAPRDEGKSVVFSLGPVGPGGVSVVAKELLSEAASVELTVYRDVLPLLTIQGPKLIGWIDSIDDDRAWLFLEEIEGPAFDETDPVHVVLASRWLAELHVGTSNNRKFDELLPKRGPDHYTSLAVSTLTDLEVVSDNPALTVSQLELLGRLSNLLSEFLLSADSFAELYEAMPRSVVHGDFKGRNLTFSKGVGQDELRVFDWSEAHLGAVAVDTWWTDFEAYRLVFASQGLEYANDTIDDWRRLGLLMHSVSAASWEMPRLRYGWVQRTMRRISVYERQLRLALLTPHEFAG